MADFCQQDAEALFGQVKSDFFRSEESRRKRPLTPDHYWPVICEGCGPTLVDDDGKCMGQLVEGGCFEKHGVSDQAQAAEPGIQDS